MRSGSHVLTLTKSGAGPSYGQFREPFRPLQRRLDLGGVEDGQQDAAASRPDFRQRIRRNSADFAERIQSGRIHVIANDADAGGDQTAGEREADQADADDADTLRVATQFGFSSPPPPAKSSS